MFLRVLESYTMETFDEMQFGFMPGRGTTDVLLFKCLDISRQNCCRKIQKIIEWKKLRFYLIKQNRPLHQTHPPQVLAK